MHLRKRKLEEEEVEALHERLLQRGNEVQVDWVCRRRVSLRTLPFSNREMLELSCELLRPVDPEAEVLSFMTSDRVQRALDSPH